MEIYLIIYLFIYLFIYLSTIKKRQKKVPGGRAA